MRYYTCILSDISVLRQAIILFEVTDLWYYDLHNLHHVIHWRPMPKK